MTDGELNTLLSLKSNPDVSRQTFKSKNALKMLSRLADKGWIDFDPFGGTAPLTEAGRAALASRDT